MRQLAMSMFLAAALVALAGSATAQDGDASTLARHWLTFTSEDVEAVEAMGCDDLSAAIDSRAHMLLTVTAPDLLAPDARWELGGDLTDEFVAVFTRAKLGLETVVWLEKRCFEVSDMPSTSLDYDGEEASVLARANWTVDADQVASADGLDCGGSIEGASGLGQALDVTAWTLLTRTQPDLISPDAQQDWNGAEDDGLVEALIRGRLAMFAVAGVEKGCFNPIGDPYGSW